MANHLGIEISVRLRRGHRHGEQILPEYSQTLTFHHEELPIGDARTFAHERLKDVLEGHYDLRISHPYVDTAKHAAKIAEVLAWLLTAAEDPTGRTITLISHKYKPLLTLETDED